MSTSWQREVDQSVDRHFEQMVAIRRHLHSHPEISGQERQTSLYVYQLLNNAGMAVRIGPEGRGVIVDAPAAGAERAPRIALRADLDALPIHDEKNVPYRSQRNGVMHACGHDAHSAMVVGAVLAVRDLQNSGELPWQVPVRGIFQPAEETCEGAREMIDAGAMDGIQAILGLHVDPSRDVGRIGLRQGTLTANCDNVLLKVTGRGGHSARPHEASDPIAAGAHLINSLYSFVPRRTDSQEAVVLTIGQIRGANALNVIPEWIELGGTLRTLDRKVRERTLEHIQQLADGIGKMSGTQIEVSLELGSGSVHNDERLIEILRTAGGYVLCSDGIDNIERPSMGSEDFAFYLDHVPGAMFRIGCASVYVGDSALHSPTFDVDNEALRIGARMLAHSVILWSDRSCFPTSSPASLASGN